jgi:two-component sensor histidine kinase
VGALCTPQGPHSRRYRAQAVRGHQSLLITALDQRVRNLLARIAVVAKDTRQGSGSLDAYIQALERRIQSMADAPRCSARIAGSTLISPNCRHQLAPYATDANTIIDGPNVRLTVAATQTLAMVLRELVTSAAKYGAPMGTCRSYGVRSAAGRYSGTSPETRSARYGCVL